MMEPTTQAYALAIRALGPEQVVPVVYDLNSASIEVGSAEDNHIVLNGPGVEPYHLALRWIDSQLYALVNRLVAERHKELVWLEKRSGDNVFCPEHGQITVPDNPTGCPQCEAAGETLWLLRPLQAGDVFPIGNRFEASVLNQGTPNQAGEDALMPLHSPWPESAWLQNPPRPPVLVGGEDELALEERDYPFEDSNLWFWNPASSPFPVFMHQRVNRYVTRHACENSDREVGGVLLGHIFRDPEDGVTYPVIDHALAGRFATEARGHLTFTRETWLDINKRREDLHPDEWVVGWYHTHPGLDIFLSDWDLFIHRNFFHKHWQVALVLDPHQDAASFFTWADGDILDPQRPAQLFRMADLDEIADARRTRVRIKLGERVP